MSARLRPGVCGLASRPSAPWTQGPPADFLRFGFQYSNGQKATNQGGGARVADAVPDQPILQPLGVSGRRHGTDWRYWAWPLPPAGPVSLICQWPAPRIPETHADIEAAVILDAVDDCIDLWPPG
ncbi:hypothetical protein [Actinomadura opuntiae]|uniref:hypothetical protein n=1 Tax=Actinomadura sp. OS1-43 TaxID=604315 RepID=UPI00255A8E22|nr:hypothetical protein [Actinomadura sp. OS1-43]